ncbi:hypothetical protein QWT69_03010 [Sporosarcina oncorhynchi]|uniref:Uncharacterized protein n=1 Tax=Sporosarcina oncorhynchi TaxID=3056444 RepID=A0ABZ0L7G5_9BACL|nr:hypothetical protein [Sporosarcina sp. T2O-4]WOV88109.1 hypothetical protein QWT69_03010 [Sporosarcina sp. T2O-4]
MKMKKSLLMVVLMLAMSSLMAAMSYSSATVTSAMSGTVTNTDTALLALENGNHQAAVVEDGVLKIDFNKGEAGNSYGLQKNSEYIWNELFTIRNNSVNRIYASVKTEGNPAAGVKIFVKVGGGQWTQIDSLKGIEEKLPVFAAGSSEHEMKVDMKIVVESNADLGKFNPNLVVSGEIAE